GGNLYVPGVWSARSGQLGPTLLHAEHKHFGLDRTLDRPWRARRRWAQAGSALASTWARVTFMLCDSPACFWSAGTI
ncbi:MAG: hypothetical protein QOI23_1669, partial [Chloroflexota bacterium]|nr:hypothetical protein [Chloroflexota bacterium]